MTKKNTKKKKKKKNTKKNTKKKNNNNNKQSQNDWSQSRCIIFSSFLMLLQYVSTCRSFFCTMCFTILDVIHWWSTTRTFLYMSRGMAFPIRLHVRLAKTQISPRIRTVWSVFAVRLKTLLTLGYPQSALRRLWSDRGYIGWSESSLGSYAVL